MKRALITGITGQDGSYLAEYLLEKGYQVHGLVRPASGSNLDRIGHLLGGPQLQLHEGDLTDGGRLVRVLAEVRPEEIYNLGAQTHVAKSFESADLTMEINARGVLRLLEGIRVLDLSSSTRFYQASTSELFGSVSRSPQNEETPFHPRSPYGVSKLFAHWITVNFREAYGLFACCGILFNHESPRRGEDFVTRKVTRAMARIATGLQSDLYLGNLDALRDWGHARDYVRMPWKMLQQKSPEDFVIATGVQSSVRDFVTWAAEDVGIALAFEGHGQEEIGIAAAVSGDAATHVMPGQILVRVDPRFYRPSEVGSLRGDAAKAKELLNWQPKITARELCREMAEADLEIALQERFSGASDRS